jgi:hypothetical protein
MNVTFSHHYPVPIYCCPGRGLSHCHSLLKLSLCSPWEHIEERRCNATQFEACALDESGLSTSHPAYCRNRRLGGLQCIWILCSRGKISCTSWESDVLPPTRFTDDGPTQNVIKLWKRVSVMEDIRKMWKTWSSCKTFFLLSFFFFFFFNAFGWMPERDSSSYT